MNTQMRFTLNSNPVAVQPAFLFAFMHEMI